MIQGLEDRGHTVVQSAYQAIVQSIEVRENKQSGKKHFTALSDFRKDGAAAGF